MVLRRVACQMGETFCICVCAVEAMGSVTSLLVLHVNSVWMWRTEHPLTYSIDCSPKVRTKQPQLSRNSPCPFW